MVLLQLIGSRLALAALTILIVSAIIFGIVELLPGDVATRILGRAPDPDQLALLRRRLNLDVPVVQRYFEWLWGFIRGDLGVSLVTGQAVTEIVGRRLGNTLLLSGVALALYVPLATIPAAVQALHRDRPLDHAISGLTLGLLALPDFLLGTLLLIFFAVWLPIVPATSIIDETSSLTELVAALILPAATIAIVMATYAMRYLRDSLIEVLQSDYIRMARLNGLSGRLILWRHALPNALVPTLNVTALNLTYLIGGVVIVERIFNFPGFGNLLVGALMQLDVPVIQATVLIAALAYIAGNLAADIGAMLLNPRLRAL